MTREIRIRQVRNGYQVSVGCWDLVFTELDKLVIDLARYFRNPKELEEEYRKKYPYPNTEVEEAINYKVPYHNETVTTVGASQASGIPINS